MINWKSKPVWFGIVLLLMLLFGVPMAINEFYNIGGYKTNWAAGDVLLFYGTSLGGLATLLAVVITIKHENKRRRYEEKRQTNATKLIHAQTCLHNALQILDAENITVISLNVNNPFPTIDNLQRFSIKIRQIKHIESLFDLEQKNIISVAIDKLADYAKEYSDLVGKLAATYLGLSECKQYRNYIRLIDLLLLQSPEKNEEEINQIRNHIAQLKYTDSNKVLSDAFEIRKKVVMLSNEKYSAVYDATIAGIKALEHYEKQLALLK